MMSALQDCLVGSYDVVAITAVSYRQLDYWYRSGLLPAPTVPAHGSGSARQFGFVDVLRVRVVAALRRSGASIQAVRQAIEILGREWGLRDPLTTGRLLVVDKRVCLDADEDTLWDILRGQSMARAIVVLDVGELARETAEALERFCVAS